jgi:GH25 family lysozyme M1 (1,4-beta-N-acetylmuramidase)
MSRVIDISMWQGSIDFAKVKSAGVEAVILRCNNWNNYTNSVEKDPRFEEYYTKAKAAGLDVGVYYYTWQSDVLGARKDAELCMEYLRGKQFEYPIYFDLEWHKALSKGKSVCSAMVEAFCNALEEQGYFAGLYISRSPLQSYITETVANRYALWIAEYGVNKPNYNGTYGMWQYSDSGRIDGISGNVDLDECYLEYPDIIKGAGLNGYDKPAEDKPKKFPKGDLNEDGVVDIEDVNALVDHITGRKPLE